MLLLRASETNPIALALLHRSRPQQRHNSHHAIRNCGTNGKTLHCHELAFPPQFVGLKSATISLVLSLLPEIIHNVQQCSVFC